MNATKWKDNRGKGNWEIKRQRFQIFTCSTLYIFILNVTLRIAYYGSDEN
jgi:hypothetical protein